MGEPEVRAKNRENKKKYVVDSLKNKVNSCLKSRDKINNTIKNLGSLLQEKYEFIDEDGLKRTILGEKSTPKQQAKGIYGTRDVFVTPGYKGQPFEEVGREMPAHFKMYCLINGISDKEMLSIGEKAPKGALREKLLLLKKEFIAMVANKDMAAIEDYYVGIADYVEKKLPILMSCDSPEKLVKYADEFCLIRGATSYLQQTLRLNDYSDANPTQIALINNVNKKLAAQGKKYNLQALERAIYPFDYYISVLVDSPLGKNYKPDKNINYQKIAGESFELYPVLRSIAVRSTGLIDVVKETKQKAFEKGCDYNNTFPDYDVVFEFINQNRKFSGEELYENILNEFSLPFDDHGKNLKYFSSQLAKVKNAAGFRGIVKLMSDIEREEKQTSAKAGSAKLTDYEKIADAYVNLKEQCDTVINDANKSFSDQEIELAYRLKNFAVKTLEDPDLGMIVAAKERYVETLKQSYDMQKKTSAIHNNFVLILREPYTHTDSTGKVRVISGERNDPENQTLGILDMFESPEFKGQPLHEVSRNMFSHFKIYCLAKGLSEDELMSLENPEIQPELRNKLLDMKKDFLDMFIEKDLDRISDMYAGILELVNNDKDRLLRIVPGNAKCLKDDPAVIIKYNGSQSWYAQSVEHEGSNETEMGKELVRRIDKKLADKGLGFTFNQAAGPLALTDTVSSVPSTIKRDHITYKEMQSGDQQAMTLALMNTTSTFVQNNYIKYIKENPDGNWLKAFPDNQKRHTEYMAEDPIYDGDVFLERAFLYDKESGFGETFRQKNDLFKDSFKVVQAPDKYPESKTIKSSVMFLRDVVKNARNKLLANNDEPGIDDLKAYIAASQMLYNPQMIRDGAKYMDALGKVNKDAALEAYGNLSQEERIQLLESEDDDIIVGLIDDYQYIVELRSEKHKSAEAMEEERALAAYYSKPARDLYVAQQKVLGKLLEKQKNNTISSEELGEKYASCLSVLIAAKQTEKYIKENYNKLSEQQIKDLTSDRVIGKRAALIAATDEFSKLAKDYKDTDKLRHLAIGAEHVFNEKDTPIMAATEISENAAGELTSGFEEESNSLPDISVENPDKNDLVM